ncbi:hypothetical protein [Streptococcus sp. CSL10205-OR2]|uniref:hypothetical protein n=1 Tax=Streptococcus sp. CSL10205-OR2 TaxID=2980558 RepID=UPI0021D85090|nr:hypothetical protein [Streptococcus sp. CSL10205-OR2]MCU9534022.1 hypothetical protein [Streptococcus sp. CSL10205-OR2]
MKVKNFIELKQAILANEKEIELMNSMSVPNTIKLNPGQRLTAGSDNILLSFINGDGVALTQNNAISGIAIQTSPAKRAIYIDSTRMDLGQMALKNLVVTGMVQLMTRGINKTLSVVIDELDIVSADSRFYPERPMKYGVNVYQGALTIYNFNPEEGSEIKVVANNVSVGRQNAPVLGSGIFISGFNDDSGPVHVEQLTTNDVYSNGMIPSGQPNLITGGIFIVYGAHAKEIVSNGVVVTYGTNDMVLDVWGSVDRWIVKEEVISYGESGIGFVNFGDVKDFRAEKTITTNGLGARGFNQYDGTIEKAYFEKIVTKGNGSIGMQFSKPVGDITIGSDISTSGSVGQTLVKGQIMTLAADAISVLAGGSIKTLDVKGNIETHGANVVSYHVNGGTVDKMTVAGKVIAKGEGAKEVVVENDGKTDLTAIEAYL